jgi:hypothetical protein
MANDDTTRRGDSGSRSMRDHAAAVLAEQAGRERAAAERIAGDEAETEALSRAPMAADDSNAAVDYLADGMRVDQALAMRHLCPGSDAQSWAMSNVCLHGKGTHMKVGRVVGVAIAAEDKVNEVQGKQISSILLTGQFRMQSDLTGEVRENAELYLPTGYAKQIKTALKMGAESVEFDVSVGIEATGKSIPYAWTVISHLRARRMDRLERIWQRRQPALIETASAAAD